MAQNITQWTATGSYSDASTADITNTAAWTVSDTSIITIGGANGQVTIQPAGSIWGATVGVTATLSPGTPGTASLLVIASDSGSVAPRMPQLNEHWSALGLSPWGSWWGFQEASGSDTVVGSGSAPFNLTRSDGATTGDGTGLHQNAEFTGWTRRGIVMSGSTGQRLWADTGTGPDCNTTSVAWLSYGQLQENHSIGAQGFMGWFHVANAGRMNIAAQNVNPPAGGIRLTSFNGSKNTVGPFNEDHSDRLHPFLLIWNASTSELWGFSDDVIAMSGGQPTVGDGAKGLGNRTNVVPPSSSFVFLACATGSIVERLCDPSASADFLSRLGWNVPWKTCPTDSGSIKCPFLDIHYKELGLTTWTTTWNFQGMESQVQNSYDQWSGYSSEGWQLAGAATTAGQIAAGWKRKAVIFPSSNSTRLATIATANMKYDQTGSMAIIGYVSSSIAIANRQFLGQHGTSTTHQPVTFVATLGDAGNKTPVLYCAGATATGSAAICDGRYHPLLIVYDATNSRAKLYTDLEKVTGSFNALSLVASVTGNLGFGGRGIFTSPPPMGVVWGAFCTGALAESLSDDGVASDYLKRLGWSVPW